MSFYCILIATHYTSGPTVLSVHWRGYSVYCAVPSHPKYASIAQYQSLHLFGSWLHCAATVFRIPYGAL